MPNWRKARAALTDIFEAPASEIGAAPARRA